MKNLLLVFVTMLHCLVVQAQPFQTVNQTHFENQTGAFAVAPDGGMFLLAQQGEPILVYSNAFLYKFDSLGIEEWVVELPGVERSIPTDLKILSDGSVLVCGYTEGCDYGWSGFIGRYSGSGDSLWHWMADFEEPLAFDLPNLLAMTLDEDDGLVYALSYNDLIAFEIESGVYQQAYTLPAPYALQTVFYRDGLFYLAGYGGLYSWSLATGASEKLADITASNKPYLGILPFNDSLLFAYNSDGHAVFCKGDSVDFVYQFGGPVKHAAVNPAGAVCVIGGPQVRFFDANLQSVGSILPSLDGLEPKFVQWTDSGIVLAGEEKNTFDATYFNKNFWLQSYQTNGQTVMIENDAALESLAVEEMPMVFPGTSGPPYFTAVYGGKYKVLLRNEGSEVLQSVKIQTGFYGLDMSFFCILNSSAVFEFNNLQLAPGADTMLELSNINTPDVNGFFAWELCVWTSLPNGTADADHANNMACATINLSVPVTEPDTGAFTLFSNPATDACTITWGENLRPATVQVYDVYGRLLLSERLDSHAGRYDLKPGAWPSGLYTVVLDKAVRRLVKQ